MAPSLISSSSRELAAQQHPGSRPIALHRSHGETKYFADLFLGHSTEESALDDAGQSGVDQRDAIERLMDVEQEVRIIRGGDGIVVERDGTRSRTTLVGRPSSSAID